VIANALRVDIEKYSSQAKLNPAYAMAREGKLGRKSVVLYVSNILHLLRHTPPYLERAKKRALERGDRRLAAFFDEKMAEETGHDRWAEQDLFNLRDSFGVASEGAVTPALRSLLAYLEETIDQDPTLYLSYILFAEYFTVLEGPEWLALLEDRCGVPQGFMTAIANHVELDKEHVAEGLDMIDVLVTDPSYLDSMRRTLHQSIQHFDRFMCEVAESAN
jgi:hypothetical protein